MRKRFAGCLSGLAMEVVDLLNRKLNTPRSEVVQRTAQWLLMAVIALSVPAAHALQLTVAWDNNASGATSFKVERSTDGVSFGEIATVAVPTTTYVDTNLTAGSYSYRVRAYDGTNYSAYSNIAVYSTDTVPTILTQPVSQTVVMGSGVSFSVTASGSPAPTFQWLKNGATITGATGSSYSIAATTSTDAATYSVVATNQAGAVTSNGATLTVTIAPVFTTQPVSQSVVAGSAAVFTVAASGTPAPSFQWYKNGVSILGATGTSLSFAGVTTSDAATYTAVAMNSAGSVTSTAATLTVTAATTTTAVAVSTGTIPGHLVNVSSRAIPGQGAQQAFSIDVTVSGSSKAALFRAIGPGLAAFTPQTFADPKLSVATNGTIVATNDNWGGTALLTSTFNQVGAFALAGNSKDSALLYTLAPQRYTASLSGKSGGVAMLEVYDADTAFTLGGRFAKITATAPVGTGEGLLITGFTIRGDTALRLIIRAVGPSLAGKGVLADPKLEIYSGKLLVQGNDNWGGSLALSSSFAEVGASLWAQGSKDAAIDITLQPGTYSAVISGVNNTTGVAQIEFYEAP